MSKLESFRVVINKMLDVVSMEADPCEVEAALRENEKERGFGLKVIDQNGQPCFLYRREGVLTTSPF